MLDGLRGETSIAELCRREGIAESMYYSWSKEFLEAGKRRLAGDTARAATTDEVKQIRREAQDLKEVVAEQALELRLLKKSMIGDGGDQSVARSLTPAERGARLPLQSAFRCCICTTRLRNPLPQSIIKFTAINHILEARCRPFSGRLAQRAETRRGSPGRR